MVPVNLRPLGNQFGLGPLVLPIGLDNPVERVLEVRKRMAGLKDSMQPLLAFGLLGGGWRADQACPGRLAQLVFEEGHCSDDQRARAARETENLRIDD